MDSRFVVNVEVLATTANIVESLNSFEQPRIIDALVWPTKHYSTYTHSLEWGPEYMGWVPNTLLYGLCTESCFVYVRLFSQ